MSEIRSYPDAYFSVIPRVELPAYFLEQVAAQFPDESKLPKDWPPYRRPELRGAPYSTLLAHKAALQTYQLRLPRTPEIQLDYDKVTACRIAQGIDPKTYVEEVIMQGKPLAITFNDFPAAVGEDVVHKILWRKEGVPFKAVLKHVGQWVIDNSLQFQDIIIVKNPAFNQSIPQVDHWHIYQRTWEFERFNCD